jgi:peptide/nickel transport system permease protein
MASGLADAAGAPEVRPGRRRLRVPLNLVAGGLIVGMVVAAALAANHLVRFPYNEFHYDEVLKPPSRTYLFGTDMYGRDVFSRVIVGGRTSLAYGLGCAGLGLLVGLPLGLWAGYRGGWIDEAVMRSLDVFMSIPPLMLGLLVLAMTVPALWKAILAIGLLSAPAIARIVRSLTLSLRHEEFVQAARARGESDAFVVFSEILPNALPAILVEMGFQFTFGILLGAALSFLGLGAQPPSSDWGLMISEARELVTVAPWISLFPGLAMFVTVIGFNLLGDGLHEAIDPRGDRTR